MLDKILSFAEKYNMFPPGSTVVCGLSGGADSVSLLLALSELSRQLNITVEALHVNHCLRGEESDRDEAFCRQLCARLEITFTAVACDVRSFAKHNSLSDEEAARKLRYDIFAGHSVGKLIATAHNANDNLETVILNLARGTALKGLSGIPPVRGNIVRPLLAVSRCEIENFLRKKNTAYVTDSTNLSDNYTRNKIRHSIIPVLNEINGSVIETSVTAIDAVRTENSFIESETDKVWKVCAEGNTLTGLSRYPEVIRKRCIAKLLSSHSLPYSYDRLSKADRIALNSGKINVSGNFYLVSDGTKLILDNIQPQIPVGEIYSELKPGKNKIFDNKALYAEIISDNNFHINEIVNTKLAIYYLDYDKIKGRVFVRNRRFGDKIRLCGRNFTSSIKKLINEKVSPDFRNELHFIEDDDGTIFAEMIGVADRTAPDGNTVKYLKITVAED